MKDERKKKLIEAAQQTLLQRLQDEKEKNRRFSLRTLARGLRVDHSLLSKFLRGKKSLSLQQLVGIGQRLQTAEPWLSEAQEDLAVAEAKAAEEAVRPKKIPGSKRKIRHQLDLTQDKADFIANWYDTVILEMTALHQPDLEPEWIASRLGHSVTPAQCADSLHRLQRLGLLRKSPQGHLLRSQPDMLIVENEIPKESIRHFHRQVLARAIKSVDELPIDDRQILACTVALKKHDLPKAQQILRNALKKITGLGPAHEADEIFQVSNQMVRVTFQERAME